MFGFISLEHNHKRLQAGRELATDPCQTQTLGIEEDAEAVIEVSPSTQKRSFALMAKTVLTGKANEFRTLVRNKFRAIAQTLGSDFQIIFERDPAARNGLEVLCCYPGLHALVLHRIAHWLHQQKIAFFPRLISHLGRFLTGIEIHPGATIGRGVFIDHGMGVVIGETAIIGDYCLIYQNVTLGGTGKETGKRHPTLGTHVVVGTGAKVLGNIEIGSHVRIGAGSIVLRNVPSDCTVVGVPGRIISRSHVDCPLEHGKLPDVEASVIRSLVDRIEQLEQQLQNLIAEEIKLNLVKGTQQENTSPNTEQVSYPSREQVPDSNPVESLFSHSVTPEQEFLVCELPQEFFRDNSLLNEDKTLAGVANQFPPVHSLGRSQQPK